MTNTEEITTTESTLNDAGGTRYLTFHLADEKYGIPLTSVKEIIGIMKITEVPKVPTYFKGIINLRGIIISIIDLRVKLSLKDAPIEPKKTSIIITEYGETLIGTIVDSVDEVVSFTPSQIETNLDIKSQKNKNHIVGFAKTDAKKLVIILDIAKTLDVKDLEIIQNRAAAS